MDPNSPICIFCDQLGKLSGEHMWPEWMHEDPELVPRGGESHSQLGTRLNKNAGRVVIAPTPYERQGPGRNRKLPIACKGCNGGWMGSIEKAASDPLRALHLGRSRELSATDQRAIARWASLRSIVFQYTLDDRVAIPYRDRKVLAHGDGISEEWRVWIGIHDSSWREGKVRQATATVLPRNELNFAERLNSAVTLLGFGRIVLYTVRSPSRVAGSPPLLFQAYCLRQIWPVEPGQALLPEIALDEAMFQVLCNSIVEEALELGPE